MTVDSAAEMVVEMSIDLTPPISGTVRKLQAGRRIWSKEEDKELRRHADLLWRRGMFKKDLASLLGKVISGCTLESIKRRLQTLEWQPQKTPEESNNPPVEDLEAGPLDRTIRLPR